MSEFEDTYLGKFTRFAIFLIALPFILITIVSDYITEAFNVLSLYVTGKCFAESLYEFFGGSLDDE